MAQVLRVLMLGDSIGKTGRALFARHAHSLKTNYSLDAIIVNGENSGDKGVGITPEIVTFFKKHGADIVTSGNHIWDEKSIIPYLAKNNDLLRPANFPASCSGKGMTFFSCKGFQIGVMNLMGRVFMEPVLDCPFEKAENLLKESAKVTPIMLVDFHAEATSEKLGLAYYLEGKVTAVVGTHTHTLTNDARILPGGTAYVTDLGMSGSLHSLLGFEMKPFLEGFLTCMGQQGDVETQPPYIMSGVIITIDPLTGKALAIENFSKQDDQSLEGLS
jgi:metallophosphoesterase (TIGR00282 family)